MIDVLDLGIGDGNAAGRPVQILPVKRATLGALAEIRQRGDGPQERARPPRWADSPPRRPAIVNLRLTAEPCNGRITPAHALLGAEQTITRSRLTGFHRALAEHGIDPAGVPMWNIEENTFEVCAPVIEAILDSPDDERPDLLLCMSDRIALTAVTLAEQRGLRIPEDLRITSFDGIAEGQYRSPRLTTVRQDSVEKGRMAARMILGLTPAVDSLLSTELIIGESCP